MVERSVRSNLQSVLTDCPHREKLGWLEVAHLMGPSIMSRYDVHNLYRKTCRDMTESQLANGLVPDIAPEYTRFSKGFFESPEWGSASVQIPYLLYKFYNDREILSRQYPTMCRYIDYLASTRNAQGLVLPGAEIISATMSGKAMPLFNGNRTTLKSGEFELIVKFEK